MKNKTILWVIGVALAFIFVCVYGACRQDYKEHHKNKFVFPPTMMALNITGVHYLDTITMVVLNKTMNFDTIIVTIIPMAVTDFADGDGPLIAYVDKDPQTPHKYWMHVNPDAARKDPYTLIAHECVHISQYESGRLYSSTITYGMVFDGYTYSFKKVPYLQRPFEIIAYTLQSSYAAQVRHLVYDKK